MSVKKGLLSVGAGLTIATGANALADSTETPATIPDTPKVPVEHILEMGQVATADLNPIAGGIVLAAEIRPAVSEFQATMTATMGVTAVKYSLDNPEARSIKIRPVPKPEPHHNKPKHRQTPTRPNLNTVYGREKYVYTYFRRHGFTAIAAAAVEGNFVGGEDRTLDPTITNGESIGEGQWQGARLIALANFAASRHLEELTVPTETSFSSYEFHTDFKSVFKYINSTNSLSLATDYVRAWYEITGPASEPGRYTAAQAINNDFSKLPGINTIKSK